MSIDICFEISGYKLSDSTDLLRNNLSNCILNYLSGMQVQ